MLYIFVEGDDDSTFFKRIIMPFVERLYRKVRVIEYSNMKNKLVNAFLKSALEDNHDVLFVTDINSSPCVNHRKDMKADEFEFLEHSMIEVVIKKIESWYLAGLTSQASENLGLNHLEHTDDIGRGKFKALKPSHFSSLKDYKLELLNNYCIITAQQKNSSFQHMATKLSL